MTEPTFRADVNIAMKIPRQDYEATLAFYRDTLGLEVDEDSAATDVSDVPTVSRTAKVQFGANTLWLDQVDNYTHPELWLELHTDDLEAATKRLAATGIHPVDEVEPLTNPDLKSHWIKNPAGIVHLLAERSD